MNITLVSLKKAMPGVIDHLEYDKWDLKRGNFFDLNDEGEVHHHGMYEIHRICYTELLNDLSLIITNTGKIAKVVDFDAYRFEFDLKSQSKTELISLEEAKRLVDKYRALKNFK